MEKKDLFDAIHNVDENYIADAWKNTDADHPIVLRPKKSSAKKTIRNIMLGVGGAAAAAAIGFAVFTGTRSNNSFLPNDSSYSYKKIEPMGSHYAAEMILAPNDSIVQVGVRGYLQSNIDLYRSEHPELEKLDALFFPEKVDFYYFNDVPVSAELLSDETIEWLCEYYDLTEEEKAKEDIGCLTDLLLADPYHRIRYGDLGWMRDNITDDNLPIIEKYCSDIANLGYGDPTGVPQPDIFYFKDHIEERPYTRKMLDQSYDNDSVRFLDWYCRLCEADQDALAGYVYNHIDRNPIGEPLEFPETLYYKGTEFKSDELDYDTALYITWYNGLTDELKEKVGFIPSTLAPDNVSDLPDSSDTEPDKDLPIDLVGADGVKLTYKDLKNANIYKDTDTVISDEFGERNQSVKIGIEDIEQWDSIICKDFVYLAEPGDTEFKRYNVGDEICGLKIKEAEIMFKRSNDDQADPALQYVRGTAIFEGNISADILVIDIQDESDQGSAHYRCAFSGLPVIDMDEEARKQGKIVPKTHTAEEFADDLEYLSDGFAGKYRGIVFRSDDALDDKCGTIVQNVNIEFLDIFWQDCSTNNPRCGYIAFLAG